MHNSTTIRSSSNTHTSSYLNDKCWFYPYTKLMHVGTHITTFTIYRATDSTYLSDSACTPRTHNVGTYQLIQLRYILNVFWSQDECPACCAAACLHLLQFQGWAETTFCGACCETDLTWCCNGVDPSCCDPQSISGFPETLLASMGIPSRNLTGLSSMGP